MSTVKEIEQAIKGLRPNELAEFRHWFTEWDGAAWDAQIDADAQAGKLDVLAEEALAEYRAGKSREI